MLTDFHFILNILGAVTAILTPISLVITLSMLVWQTKQLRKQIKFNTITSINLHLKSVNELLLQDEKIAQTFGESREEVLASIIFGTFELWFHLHQEHLTDHLWWQADQATITDALKSEYMRQYWARYKHHYHHDFAQFIDKKIPQQAFEKQLPLEIPQTQE
jgi:hypothetical protein